jgi:hypothetical protein
MSDINKRYLLGSVVLFLGIFVLEGVLGLFGIEESILFLIYWVLYFVWLFKGKGYIKKRST